MAITCYTVVKNAQILASPECRDDNKPHRKQWMLQQK